MSLQAQKSALAARSPDVLAALDAAHRARALDLGASFIVQAPAGAGKTELLTQRFLGLLATVEAPEQIVAITFTRKAAAEMRNRILLRLERAADAEPATAHERTSWRLARAAQARDAELGWGLAGNPERLRILTIDALCASLVRQMPYLSRFGGMPRIADKPALHYAEAARRTVAAIEDFPCVGRALSILDNDAGRLGRLLVAMLAFREQWLPHVHRLRGGGFDAAALGAELTANLERLVQRDLAAVAEAFLGHQSAELMAAARFVAQANPDFAALADWHAPLGSAAADLPCWQALTALLVTSSSGTPRKQFNARIGLPATDPVAKAHAGELKAVAAWLDDNSTALAALKCAARCPWPRYAEADLAAIETFAEVLVLATGFLWTLFQEAGETDFAAVAERAVAALGAADAPTDLALRLDYAIRHLLVDEFQDTNPQQIELLEKLTAGWQAGDGRTLFVVGDPMQSIYRFRKADVGLFLRAWERGIGDVPLEALTLYRNNRSVPAVVEWVNGAFGAIFPAAPDAEQGRVAYAPAIATREAEIGGVSVHPILVPKEMDDGEVLADQQEAQAMLDVIEATWRARPNADIAVLVRARDHLAPLADCLRRVRPALRYEAVEIESLAARQPIQDLLALTRALVHRADRVNWLAILRAPWCGLTLADLYQLSMPTVKAGGTAPAKVGAGETARPTLWTALNDAERCAALSADGQTRLAHLREALAPLLETPGRHALRRTVEIAWRRLGGPATLAGASERVDVATYFALLDRLDTGGPLDMARLDEEVASLYAAPSSDPQAGRLKFMTIHKAKGLEFDTVLLPGLHRRAGRGETRLLAWDSARDAAGVHRLVVAPYRPDGDEAGDGDEESGAGGAGDAVRRYIEGLEAARADQEARRLLYVAATRAVRALHLFAAQRPRFEPQTGSYAVAAPRKLEGTACNILWPLLAGDFQAAAAQLVTTGTEAAPASRLADFVPQLQRLPLASLRAVQVGAPEPAMPGETLVEEASELRTLSQLAPHIGTLVHRYLELIATEGLERWGAARLAACLPACEKWLRQRGHDAATARKGAERVRHALGRALASERGRWILQDRPRAACELALTQHEAAALINHVIDRSFIEDDVRWIIDYKTGAHEGGDVDAFIAARRAEYAPQLARYAALFAGEGLPIRQALYFVDLDRFELLTP